jgi:hypothetical protein
VNAGSADSPSRDDARDAARVLARESTWPVLPLDSWRETYETLHMWLQIVGKTRLALAPMENHWWQVALYVTPRGLTTSAMPSGERTVAVDFDFVDHRLIIHASDGRTRAMPLDPKPVAAFYADYLDALHELNVDVRLHDVPVEVETAIPFRGSRARRVRSGRRRPMLADVPAG